MTGYNGDVFVYPRNDVCNVVNETMNRATAIEIYERETSYEELIARVYDIGSCEENHAIAVGVTMREMYDLDFFPVEMNGYRIVECNHRPGLSRCRRHSPVTYYLLCHKSLADVRVRNDGRFKTEYLITAGVVSVPMRVDDKF